MAMPAHAKYVIIGAGIHGLSTAWNLAEGLKASGKGSGEDVLILDKTGIASGASGIACGVIRNNYFQPAMRELMAHSVDVWDSDPKAFSYHQVGYMQVSAECMRENVGTIYEQQKAIGYETEFIEGETKTADYMKSIFSDWQATGVTSVLHEKRGGFANNTAAMYGLATKAENLGVRIMSGVTVTGLISDNGSEAIKAVETDRGTITCEEVVVALGPWIKSVWDMLDLPKTVDIKGSDDTVHTDIPMWRYWALEEGTLGIDPNIQKTNDGGMPPVIHVDSDAPLLSDVDGALITDELWGIYYKPDFNFGGIQGGAMPYPVKKDAEEVEVDPYGVDSPEFIVDDNFAHMWCSALAFCQKRFVGMIKHYKNEPSGGIGCFTPDSFPVFDRFRDNVYIVADSNHGYKMIGVGKLVAEELLGKPSRLLKPFSFDRYARGELHPVSKSPFPWS
ncbi:MAG: FAD-binding oxidoreductase [Alphaproteobacteria bacterium]|jgi:methylglutamate dehydrogenase subunit A|nr:FAD-binding oxidoreductase [Alphaproteobacteria bacterium]